MKKSFLLMLLLFCLSAFGAHAGEAPLNPRLMKWIKSHQAPSPQRQGLSSRAHPPLSRIPSSFNTTHMKNMSIVPSSASALRKALPVPTETVYDLRSLGNVSPIRDQNPYGTCWTFAAMASSESNALKNGEIAQDYSEKHLAYYGYTDIDAKYVAFDRIAGAWPDSVYDQGGSDTMSIAILSRWTGIVAEATEPYASMGPCEMEPSLPAGIAPSASVPNSMILKGAYFAPQGGEVVGNIKYLLKNYGAVAIGIFWNEDYYNETTHAFYAAETDETNHAVTVVGWDDNYARTNFNTQPSSDGAWIVRNSWGSSWGDNGYFYVSYEDPGVVDEGGYAYEVDEVDTDAYLYLHDPLGLVSTINYGSANQQWMANIFTAVENQDLSCVSFATTGLDITATIFIYTGVTAGQPRSGTLAYQGDAQSLPLAGLHTLDLSKDVRLEKGEDFSIVVRLDSTGIDHPIAIERPESAAKTSKASASPGQSFVSADGAGWVDLTSQIFDANVCVRGVALPATTINPAINLLLLN